MCVSKYHEFIDNKKTSHTLFEPLPGAEKPLFAFPVLCVCVCVFVCVCVCVREREIE